jgi:hypothetical protein
MMSSLGTFLDFPPVSRRPILEQQHRKVIHKNEFVDYFGLAPPLPQLMLEEFMPRLSINA